MIKSLKFYRLFNRGLNLSSESLCWFSVSSQRFGNEKKTGPFQIKIEDLVAEKDFKVKSVEEINRRTSSKMKSTRQVTHLEKLMLVYLGRYNSVAEVPDRTQVKNKSEFDRDKSEALAVLQEKVFRFAFLYNYGIWLLYGLLAIIGLYYYKKDKKEAMIEHLEETKLQ